MISIALVEDEKEVIEQLLSYMESYKKEKGVLFEVSSFGNADEFLAGNKQHKFDMALLDVGLPESMSGLQLASEIRKTDAEMQIAFITNIRQYALFGYEVEAFSYLVKPVSYVNFSHLLDRGLGNLEKNQGTSVILNMKEGIIRLKSKDILSVSIDDHYLKIKTNDKVITYRDTLSHFEDLLLKEGFAKANNSQLVNLLYVEKVDKDFLVLNGENIQVSRLKKKALLDALMKYYGEQL